MKIKQRIARIETREVDLEFPLYVQHDVGDGYTYIVTYRYELQSKPVPTFLVTTITHSNDGFEIKVSQALSIDTNAATYRVDERLWLEEVEEFEKWSQECLKKLRVSQVSITDRET